jgi:ABC-type Mn2+/Zn2+ transport system ATPase subunit
MTIALRFRDLTLGYDRHPAVHHLDGVVETGDLLAVCGPNGAGKSTLLKILAGLETPDGGELSLRRGLKVRYLPQQEFFEKEAILLLLSSKALFLLFYYLVSRFLIFLP